MSIWKHASPYRIPGLLEHVCLDSYCMSCHCSQTPLHRLYVSKVSSSTYVHVTYMYRRRGVAFMLHYSVGLVLVRDCHVAKMLVSEASTAGRQ